MAWPRPSTYLILLLALAGGAAYWWWRESPVPVEVVHPTRGPAIDAIYATGTVEPTVMLPIAPRTTGRLIERNVDEGSVVRKGQVLARLDDADLASTVDELQARVGFARSQYARTENLVRQGFMSKAELDRTRADLDAAEAAVRRAQSLRGYMALVAPADGIVIRRDGEVGQIVTAGQALFYLSCCAPLRVTAEVDEEDISRVRVGQKVVLRADALPGTLLEGTVSDITPKGDPVARSYRVRIKLADPGQLKVGMTVDANLIVAERPNALLVPATAVQRGTVWVVEGDQLRRRPVQIGVSGAGRSEVLHGLDPEALVVAVPGSDLREGRAARVRSASASTDK